MRSLLKLNLDNPSVDTHTIFTQNGLSMILRFFFLVSLLFSSVSAQNMTPEKRSDFERRFKEAMTALNSGQYSEARSICEGIIKEEPQARGSLLISAMASLELFEPEKAAPRIDAFRKLEPQSPEGILISIEANQALKKTAMVQSLLKDLLELRKTNTKLKSQPFFTRERFESAPKRVTIIREYYDSTQPPFKVWEVTEVNTSTQLETRSLDFSYNVGSGESKSGDPYFFSEIARVNGIPEQINIYREEKTKPEYSVFRGWIAAALQSPPKPIYTAPYRSKHNPSQP